MAENTASGWKAGVMAWLPGILIVLAIRTFIFEPFRIPSGSMYPTLLIGDHVIVNKSAYGVYVPATLVEIPFLEMQWVYPRFRLFHVSDPKRGDIIVFRYPGDEHQTYIKRVVGLPGDHIKVRNGQVFLNGAPQEQEYRGHYVYQDQTCEDVTTRLYTEHLEGQDHDVLASMFGGSLRNVPGEIVVPPEHVFVMGDNRDSSLDSRAWGFVADDQIKGRAHTVWFSLNHCTMTPRADRLMDKLYGVQAEPVAVAP